MSFELASILKFVGAKSYSMNDEPPVQDNNRIHQMSVFMTVFFIVSEIAGGGVVALPKALAGTGWAGIAVILACGICATYSGIWLGESWVILETRWPEYQQKLRYPYPAIGIRAVAPWMRYVVSVSVDISTFGSSTIYLLLCSEMIHNLWSSAGIVGCHWVLILGAALCPLTWFGTPEEFWPAAVGAFATSLVASVLLIIAMATETSEGTPERQTVNFTDFFLSFGTIMYSIGGACVFPTIQNDMKDRRLFSRAVFFSYSVILVMYISIAATGYGVFGSDVKSNVLQSVRENALSKTTQILLGIHFFFAFLILFNPVAQDLEDNARISHKFGWKRCLSRSLLMGAAVFTCETIPQFGKIMDLVGGTTITLLSFVFPPWFYMRLCDQRDENWQGRTIPLYMRVFMIVVIVVGIIAGGIATYTAVVEIVSPDAFSKPCYINKYSVDAN